MLKVIMFILIILLSSGCSNHTQPKIPKILLAEVKHPSPPKIHSKVHKSIIKYIYDYHDRLDEANLKIRSIGKLVKE